MKWKQSYSTEILILFCSGIAGGLMTIDWFTFISGLLIFFLTSYFLVTKLKEQVIREYFKKIK